MSLPESGQQKTAKQVKTKDQFSIRKVNVKPDIERYMMRPMSPYQMKIEKHNRDRIQLSCKPNHKIGEFSTQDAIISSTTYKELNRKFVQLKREQAEEREKVLNSIREKTAKVQKAKEEKERLQNEKQRLAVMAERLAERLEFVRERNYTIRRNMEQYQSLMNAEYLRNLILSVRFQHELLHQDINPDNMTYEELLQLEEKIGNVSKGMTEEQIKKLEAFEYIQKGEAETCTICYYELKSGEMVHRFQCKHLFHSECIKQWLTKEKLCPMCKQQIIPSGTPK